jgi:hypothetical protein
MDGGIQIADSEEHPSNTLGSTLDSFEPLSNVRLERLGQAEKHEKPSISTDDGMEMDDSDEHPRNAAL